MKHQNLIIAVLLSLLVFSVGCSSIDPETGRESLSYLPARCYDFLDIIELNLGMATTPSIYAMAVCEPFSAGAGIYEAEKFGFDGRIFGQWNEKRCGLGGGVEFFQRYKKKPSWGNRYLFNGDYNPHFINTTLYDMFRPGDEHAKPGAYFDGFTVRVTDHELRWGDIGVEVCPLFPLVIDVGVSPWELFDFCFGIFGFDVLCDDDWVDPAHADGYLDRYKHWLLKDEEMRKEK